VMNNQRWSCSWCACKYLSLQYSLIHYWWLPCSLFSRKYSAFESDKHY
jgi:hypothetical protein